MIMLAGTTFENNYIGVMLQYEKGYQKFENIKMVVLNILWNIFNIYLVDILFDDIFEVAISPSVSHFSIFLLSCGIFRFPISIYISMSGTQLSILNLSPRGFGGSAPDIKKCAYKLNQSTFESKGGSGALPPIFRNVHINYNHSASNSNSRGFGAFPRNRKCAGYKRSHNLPLI